MVCLFSIDPFVAFSELARLWAAWFSFGTLLKASIEALFTMLPTEPTKLLVLGILSKLALFCFTLVKLVGEVPTRMNALLDGYCSCCESARDCCCLSDVGDNVPELDEAVAMAAAAAVKLGFLLDKCTGLVCMCNCCSNCLALPFLFKLKRLNGCRCCCGGCCWYW